jgi:hypothetical protein
MKTFLLLLLIPIVSTTCFYAGSYVFPNKESQNTIHLETEKEDSVNESSPLAQNISEDKLANTDMNLSISVTDNLKPTSSRTESLNEEAIKKHIGNLQNSISEIIQKQKFRIQKMSESQQKRLKDLPNQIKKAELDGYERGKAVTLKLLKKK